MVERTGHGIASAASAAGTQGQVRCQEIRGRHCRLCAALEWAPSGETAGSEWAPLGRAQVVGMEAGN